MGLVQDLKKENDEIFQLKWEIRNGIIIPEDDSLKLSNDGVKIDATVLYADMADSTSLVDDKKAEFAAEIYKAFLKTSCKIIAHHDGKITAFDGDRVMAVFIGKSKNTSAVKAALRIKWAVKQIINPSLNSVYSNNNFVIQHGVGIDTGELLVAKTGIRGSNDLVWVGPAANYAAKLANIREGVYNTWITERVFNSINDESKYSNGTLMWEVKNWNEYNKTIYGSSYWWGL